MAGGLSGGVDGGEVLGDARVRVEGVDGVEQGGGGRRLLAEVGGRTKFSSHAKARIEQRGVSLTADDLTRLDAAVDRMEEKGVRDALVYMSRGLAMVISVKNRTVITAVDEASAKENIFTNIDSAAIL